MCAKIKAEVCLFFTLVTLVVAGYTEAQVNLRPDVSSNEKVESSIRDIGYFTDGTYPNIRITNNSGASENPRIVCDANYCYAVWQDNRDGKYEIYWCKTDHNGQKVINDTRVSLTGSASINPAIDIDASGNSSIVWQEGTSWGNIYFCRLNSVGTKIVNDIVLSDNPLCLNPEISTTSAGISNIVYEKRAPGIHYLLYKKLAANGTELCYKTLSNWDAIDTEKKPSIDCDQNGNAYVAWRDCNNWTYGIWICRVSTDCSIPANYRIYTSNDAKDPDLWAWSENVVSLVFELNNKIYNLIDQNTACQISQGTAISRSPEVGWDGCNEFVTWQDNRDGNWEVYLCKFSGCNNLSGDQRITNNSNNSTQPDMSVLSGCGNDWYLGWQDDRDGNNEIYLSNNVPTGTVTFTVKSGGNPVENAVVTHIPTGLTKITGSDGKITFDNVSFGDEIYAFKEIGWGRTQKEATHPFIPGTGNHWFYVLCKDNRYLDNEKNLAYWYYTGNTDIIINHLITKLYPILCFERKLGINELINGKAVKTYFEEQFRLANTFLFDVTNGQVMIAAVDLYCNEENWFDSDIRIHREQASAPFVFGNNLEWPMYTKRDYGDPNSYAIICDRKFWRDNAYNNVYRFYKTLVHEMGHYFFNLGDEYDENHQSSIYCTGQFDHSKYHASIMSSNFYPEVTEFCQEIGHDDNQTFKQNRYHNLKSCWDFLFQDWNSGFNHPHFGGEDYTVGVDIPWQLPVNDPNEYYQSGPYTDDPVVVNDYTTRYDISNHLCRIIDNIGRHVSGVTLGLIERPTSSVRKLKGFEDDSLSYYGYFPTGSRFEDIIVEGLSQDDGVIVSAFGYKPIVANLLSGDSPKLIALENLSQYDLSLTRLEATVAPDKAHLNLKLKASTDSSTAITAAVLQHGTPVPTSVLMQYIGNSLFTSDVPLDTSLPLAGLIYFSDTSGLIDCESWQAKEIKADSDNYLILNNAYLAIPTASISDDGMVTVVTSPLPADQIEKGLIPFSQPLTITLSENSSLVSGIDMVLYYDQNSVDTLCKMYKWSEGNQSWESVPSYNDTLARTVGSIIHALGTFTIFSMPQPDPRLTLDFPSGGEFLAANCTTTVSWSKAIGSASDSLRVYLSYDGGRTYPLLIYRSVSNDTTSQLDWIVPDTFCNKGRTLVIYHLPNDEVIYDESDVTFTIYLPDDVNCDGGINLSDVIYKANYLLKGGPAPCIGMAADDNCDGKINLADVIYEANYLLKEGPSPCCPSY